MNRLNENQPQHMNSEIQFGELEQSEPQQALRPDQDGHFVVAQVGEIRADELMIFVDLDVMRDMEGHARTNQRVELGGVMLGQQSIDDQGRPFVVITDSLRAEHYEATKGSFKFTHDTWSQITQDRRRFRPDLEMVGWYHTHPGWSVFLSGMDLFICNNFFNRSLDVALVIDPCADDRGWFQWTNESRPTTQRTGGFFLMTGRYCQQELDYFTRIYNKEPIMMPDPRYSESGFGTAIHQPVVNLMDNRKPIFEIAIVAMLLTQFLLFATIGWKLIKSPDDVTTDPSSTQVAALEQQLSDIQSRQQQEVRDQAYQEILQQVVGRETGAKDLVKVYADLKSSHRQLQSNIDAQVALAEKLTQENQAAKREVQTKTAMVDNLSEQLVSARQKLNEADLRISALKSNSEFGEDAGDNESTGKISLAWWWLLLGASAMALLGGVLGFVLARNRQVEFNDLVGDFDAEPSEKTSQGLPNADVDSASDLTVRIVDRQLAGKSDEFSSSKSDIK